MKSFDNSKIQLIVKGSFPYFYVLMVLLAVLPHKLTAQPQHASGTMVATGDSATPGLVLIPARWEQLPLAKPAERVNDFENCLTPKQEKYLDSILTALYSKTTIELFLVSIDSSHCLKQQFNDLGLYFLTNWFANADSNSYGGVILFSNNLRKIRVFSNQNLEHYISEAEMKKVVEQGYIPGFAQGNVYKGAKEGTLMLTGILRKNYEMHPVSGGADIER
ncbi:MAG TPA: TPM domain-containing protein [Bacteroidia bacterium]|nr:TPM domain-containing protein [Bacteroidia bacterium]